MTIPSAYMTSLKNVDDILKAIQRGRAPDKFTQKYLSDLGFASSTDRLFINVLKALDFLNDAGEPLDRYYRFLDTDQAQRVLAEAIMDAYSDLYQVNTRAHEMSRTEIKNKLKTLTQGEHSDDVLSKMAGTFKKLAELADFDSIEQEEESDEGDDEEEAPPEVSHREAAGPIGISGLTYAINIQLPESRDPAVYDALFRSLREHLL